MKDAPAFDFYPERWTHGTRFMSKVERCDYMDLLCHQWTDDGLPADLAAISRLLGYKKEAQIPSIVLEKFPIADDGRRRNSFLEKLRDGQRERINNSREKGRKMAASRWNKNDACSNAQAMHKHSSSNAQAMHTAMHEECPPLTTHHSPKNPASLSLSETRKHQEPIESERRERPGSAKGDKAAAIVAAYPANGNRYEAQAAVVRAIESGENPEAILAKVKAHADRFRALHPSQRRFCPGLAVYFSEARWNDDPAGHPWTVAVQLTKEEEQRAAVKAAAAKIEKPKIHALRTVDPAQRPTVNEFAAAKLALFGIQEGDGSQNNSDALQA